MNKYLIRGRPWPVTMATPWRPRRGRGRRGSRSRRGVATAAHALSSATCRAGRSSGASGLPRGARRCRIARTSTVMGDRADRRPGPGPWPSSPAGPSPCGQPPSTPRAAPGARAGVCVVMSAVSFSALVEKYCRPTAMSDAVRVLNQQAVPAGQVDGPGEQMLGVVTNTATSACRSRPYRGLRHWIHARRSKRELSCRRAPRP